MGRREAAVHLLTYLVMHIVILRDGWGALSFSFRLDLCALFFPFIARNRGLRRVSCHSLRLFRGTLFEGGVQHR